MGAVDVVCTDSKEVFLATTALDEFWDDSKQVIFLGQWCLLYERRSYWGKVNGEMLRSPYDDVDEVEKSHQHVNAIYERILPLLGGVLNLIHGKNYSTRYWRILIGPWLQCYLLVLFERYVHIRHALDQYPDLTTTCLSESSFVVSRDTLDFSCNLLEDGYNLQLYTKIFTALGREFPSRDLEFSKNHMYNSMLGKNLKRRLFSYLMKVFVGIAARLSKGVFFRNSYFTIKNELKLAVKNFGHIFLDRHMTSIPPFFEYDSEKRNVLHSLQFNENEFERCLSRMLFEDVPQCFVEGFHHVSNEVKKNYPNYSSAILSANAWYYDEPFKQWSAESAEKGSLLLGVQHGGVYGALKIMPSENHEAAITNHYYTWGWKKDGCVTKIIPMPAPKLIEINKIAAGGNKVDILWCATSVPRYADFFQLFYPVFFSEYLSWQIYFVSLLPKHLTEALRFRPHRDDYEWSIVNRIRVYVPDIRVETWSVPFHHSLKHCRLYVCDHLSTTLIEALVANKPTILFWNPRVNSLRLEAQPYFDLLRDCGILFDTPQAAALAVDSVYDDVEKWWNEFKRQEAVRLFCERFARTSVDSIEVWSEELRRVSNLSVISNVENCS